MARSPTWISWRAAFLVNVPIAVAMIVGARAVLTETPRQRGRFDVVGALCATLGMGALVFGIIESGEAGWARPGWSSAVVVGVVLLAALVVTERGSRSRSCRCGCSPAASAAAPTPPASLYLGAMIGFFFFTTQFLQDALGFTPLQAGLGFLPMSLVNFAVALAIPRLRTRVPDAAPARRRRAAHAGRHGLAEPGRPRRRLPDLGRAADGARRCRAGPGVRPLTSSGIAGVAPSDAGAASGLVNTAHQLGMALGLAVLSAVAVGAGAGLDGPAAVVEQVGAALTAGSVLLAVALLVVLLVLVPAARSHRQQRSTAGERPAVRAAA